MSYCFNNTVVAAMRGLMSHFLARVCEFFSIG